MSQVTTYVCFPVVEKVITLIRGKVEEVSLPVDIDKVDIIVSEWMGMLNELAATQWLLCVWCEAFFLRVCMCPRPSSESTTTGALRVDTMSCFRLSHLLITNPQTP